MIFGNHHSKDQQRALCKQLIEGRHRGQDHAVVQDADDRDAEQRADDRSLAALQRAAAEHGGGDRLQLQPLRARDRLARAGARGKQDAGEPGGDAAHDVDADAVAVDVDAGEARDDRIAAERVDVAADDRARQEHLEQRSPSAIRIQIGNGRPRIRPMPMKRNVSLKIAIDWPSDMMKAMPRNIAIVPSVAMTALTRP